MARYYAPQISSHPFHITNRCQNKNRFPIPLNHVWEIFEEELYLCRIKYGFKVHAFVLMPNHYHMIATSEDEEIGKALRELGGNTSKRTNTHASIINHLWGSKTYRCVIDQPTYLMNVYRYVYQNPVRAGLVSRCEEWRYSTLSGLLGQFKMFLPVEEDTFLFNPHFDENTLYWLNEPFSNEKLGLIRKGLHKKVFKVRLGAYGNNPLLD